MNKMTLYSMVLFLFLVINSVTFLGCNVGAYLYPYSVEYSFDEFKGISFWTSRNNKLPGSCFELNPCSSKKNDRKTYYYIKLVYCSNSWFFIDSDSPLEFLIDGEKYKAKPTGRRYSKVSGGIVYEWMHYDASKELFRKIGNGGVVKIRVHGEFKGGGVLSPENKARFNSFLDELRGT